MGRRRWVVSIANGDAGRVEAMRTELARILPQFEHRLEQRRHDEGAAAFWRRLIALYPPFSVAHVAALTGPGTDRSAVWAGLALAPGRMLAYDPRGDRFHLSARQTLSSFLFLRGWPVSQIHLRPWRDDTVHDRQILRFAGRARREGKPQIAILSPYVPWPLAHGAAVRIYNLLRVCSPGQDLHLLAFVETGDDLELGPLRELCTSVTLVRKPEFRRLRWASWLPAEVHEYNTPAMHEALHGLHRDLLQVEFTQLAQYGGEVLVEHDVTMDLARQEWQRRGGLAAWWNWFRWKHYETRALRQHRGVVVMSGKDQRAVGGVVVPNGVDLEKYLPSPEPKAQRLLFVGSVRHYPNALAVRFLVEEFWPRLKQAVPEAELEIVMGPGADLYYPFGRIPDSVGLTIHGFVEDVKVLYERANLVLIPTPVSAGTNIKALEALAMERAIVSSPSGVNGLDLRTGVEVLVAEGVEEFVAAAEALLKDPLRRRTIAEHGRRVAEARFDWKEVGAKQEALWRQILS